MKRVLGIVALCTLTLCGLVGCGEAVGPERAPAGEAPSAQASAKAAAPITTGSLLAEMTDLQRLAEIPDPAYTTKQFSSYDRKSVTPADATEKGWFANGDAGQYLRVEENAGRKEYVMADMAGPGAIVRIWSANPRGTIRVYLDGNAAPVIETAMETLLGGKYAGLPRPIAGEYSKGWNIYFPIPYARHCKVTSDKNEFYYHVNYRTYPAGTPVKSFAAGDIAALSSDIEKVAATLEHPRKGGIAPKDRKNAGFEVTVSPGEEATLIELAGPQAICAFKATLGANDLAAAARATVLKMTFDGQSTVASPLGDFFGTAPGMIAYESLPLGVSESDQPEMWSHWFMPFAKSARITVKNLGQQKVTVKGAVGSVPYTWTPRSLLFHAKWRIERDIPSRPITDWSHLQATGDGRFVGGALHLVNTVKGWWGEGDEKIYVDGETFPSTFGTGSEDYYGYAWGDPTRFVHAYHNEPYVQGPGMYGNTLLNRWHLFDDIPFTKSIRFDLENWHGAPGPKSKTTRAAVTYWYARPGGKDFFKPITKEDAKLTVVPEYKAMSVPGAIEGEKMKVIEKTATVETQQVGDEFSGEAHLWWRDGKPGDKLVLGFESPAAGMKHVILRLTKAQDYGIVRFAVNDTKAGKLIDLYNDGVRPSDPIDLGEFELKAGENRLTVEIVGANPKALKRHMFGLDYLLLK